MSIPILQRSLHMITTLIVVLLISEIDGFEIRSLDETGLSSPTNNNPSIKCGGCSPCGSSSCYSSPPPPSLPPPPPPPPPPKKKSPTTPYCPPPPPPSSSSTGTGFVYMSAPPGQLYPVDPDYSTSPKTLDDAIKASFLGLGLIGLLLF